MKNISIILSAATIIGFSISCTKFDDSVYAVYTEQNFPKTPEQFVALTGPVYTAAQSFFNNNYYDLQQTCTDEVIVPTRGGDWFDGGKWQEMHFHTWTPSSELMRNSWEWGFNAIGSSNLILKMYEPLAESDLKNQTMAEVKTMRAWYYFCMMDAFGNIPIVTTFDQNASAPVQEKRNKVFEFIATELETNLPLLSEEVSSKTYGRPTKWMAHTLLAKLYLNAEVYTGIPQWDKVVEHCNAVINSGKYDLETNYFSMFAPDNGPSSKEPIFSVPFDAQKATGNLLFNKTLHYGHRDTYKLTTNPWNGWCTTPAFFDKFEDEDLRKAQWLYGQQKDSKGGNLIFNGINVILDPYFFPAFDLGAGDNLGRLAGARNVKYAPDPNAVSNNANNDIIIYRYADVLLMKTEAIVRGSTKGNLVEALESINKIRDRAFNSNPSKRFNTASLTLKAIYDERGRELVMEMTRRTDMIRFGTFDDPNLFKGQTDLATERLFPIPTAARISNSNLQQNPGYPN
ncbi:RagB/SusD family nutrient uptake outer membrane protein [Sphingobacterium tabacisoli]|uniref:RagB/SusD family nutrient uptake outer membrane protein n=2 Tax=Sphingobacterium tabacisoli TaxID=2044855 RepID=A0ABW5L6P7_9SPHI